MNSQSSLSFRKLDIPTKKTDLADLLLLVMSTTFDICDKFSTGCRMIFFSSVFGPEAKFLVPDWDTSDYGHRRRAGRYDAIVDYIPWSETKNLASGQQPEGNLIWKPAETVVDTNEKEKVCQVGSRRYQWHQTVGRQSFPSSVEEKSVLFIRIYP